MVEPHEPMQKKSVGGRRFYQKRWHKDGPTKLPCNKYFVPFVELYCAVEFK